MGILYFGGKSPQENLKAKTEEKEKDLNKKFISAKPEHFGGSNPYKIIRKLKPNPEKIMINERLLKNFRLCLLWHEQIVAK